MKPGAVEVGQRWHDDDDHDDPNYGERHYLVTASSDRRGWLDEPNAIWWEIRYADGCESAAPASWILRDTFLGTVCMTGCSPVCGKCGRRKAPVGRSVAPAIAGDLCDDECQGYRQDPKPCDLWPGEARP